MESVCRRVVLAVCILLLGGMGAAAGCDQEKPELDGFGVSPAAIDVTAGPQTVTCTMTVGDALAGVSEAECTFSSPTFLQSHSCEATDPVSGTRLNGTFSCDVTIPQYSESGVWLGSVTLDDSVGNHRSIDAFTMGLLGFANELSVTSTPDLVGPSLTSLSLTPSSVDVSAAPASISCEAGWSDTPAGLATSTCQIFSPDVGVVAGCTADTPSTGTRNSGVFICQLELPRYSDAGIWTVFITGRDQVSNATFLDSNALAGLGFPNTVTVTSNPEDITGPSLDDFDFTPKSIDVSGAPASVTCTMQISDALAGTRFALCTFLAPDEVQAQSCFAFEPSSGTRQNGSFSCVVTVPTYSSSGTWKATVQLSDQAGGLTQLVEADLAVAGFPVDLDVACDGGSAEPFLRWNSATVLAWDPIAEATRYNTYRGDLASVAFDYGSCQNSRDPDLGDTIFVEEQDPVPQQGFHFLVSTTSITGEGGLGSASDGTPRSVAAPCP